MDKAAASTSLIGDLIESIDQLHIWACDVKSRAVKITDDLAGSPPSKSGDEAAPATSRLGAIGTARDQVDSIRTYLDIISAEITRI